MPFHQYFSQHTYYNIYCEYTMLGTKGIIMIKASKVIIPTMIMEKNTYFLNSKMDGLHLTILFLIEVEQTYNIVHFRCTT